LQSLAAAHTSRVNCDEVAGDRLRQFVNRNCCRFACISWALAQISCFLLLDSSVERTVQVHTSLPPKVDGQLRCYLKLKVSHISWLIPNSPDITHVRVHWWGEDGPGTLFR